MKLYEELQVLAPQWSFCYFARDPDVDLLLLLNACGAECVSLPAFQGPVVTASPYTVDHWPVSPPQLAAEIVQHIRVADSGGRHGN